MSDNFIMPKSGEKPVYVQDMFNSIARTYDLLNDITSFWMHRGWKSKISGMVIEHIKKSSEPKILDLCCGTGDVSLALSKKATQKNIKVSITGVDFSQKMLDVAIVRNEKTTENKPEFLFGDATNLNYTDNSFDAITISFGLRNLPDTKAGLKEILRVLKPGGLFICLDLGKPKNKLYGAFYNFYFFRIVPIIGSLIQKGHDKAYTYLPQSSLHYPEQSVLAQYMNEIGFKKVKYINLAGGATVIHTGEK